MRTRLAETLGLAVDRVSVKAKRAEQLGALGPPGGHRRDGGRARGGGRVTGRCAGGIPRPPGARLRGNPTPELGVTFGPQDLQHADPAEGRRSSRSCRGRCSLYVCGITPYDVSHIGHARSALVFDVVARYLGYARATG